MGGMQSKAAAEGWIHSGPTGRASVLVEGGISPQKAQLASPTKMSLNSSDQRHHGDADKGVKRFVRQAVQHLQIGTNISQLLAGGVAGTGRVSVVVEGGISQQRAQLATPTNLSLNSSGQRHHGDPDKGVERFVRQAVQDSQIGTNISQLLAGGIAGAVSKTCTAPLARLTILFQVQGMHSDGASASLQKASIFREASRIVSEEGFRAFWRGNLITIAHRLPYSSITFYTYEKYKSIMESLRGMEKKQRENVSTDPCIRLLGGGAAGVTAASITYPLDVVRTRLAAQTNVMFYRGITHALSTICRDEGLMGLYKGLGPTVLAVGPNIGISFCAYESLKSAWESERPQDSPIGVGLACGSLSGVASSTATFPLDLARRRMQLEGAGGRAHVYNNRGLVGTFGQIIGKEGWAGLYRGILAEYLKVVPSLGIAFMTYEIMKGLLPQRHSKE